MHTETVLKVQAFNQRPFQFQWWAEVSFYIKPTQIKVIHHNNLQEQRDIFVANEAVTVATGIRNHLPS